jgi:hypothetical protein
LRIISAECGGVNGYSSVKLEADGTRKIAASVRLGPPEEVLDEDADHFW